MFKNYLVAAFRNIKKHKWYSFINIAGLAIGMSCCMILFLWAWDELSYDAFHENGDDIFRVVRETRVMDKITPFAPTPNALAPVLKERFPEIINYVRFRGGISNWIVQYGEKSFLNDRLGTAGPSLFEVFTFPFLKGDPKTALVDRYSVVVTESMAKKYFDDEEPMGKVIKINRTDFKVTGVIKDVPHNSHVQFDYVFPIVNMKRWWGEDLKSWKRDFRFHTYILLKKNSSPDELSRKISGIVKEHNPESDTRLYLQPLKDIYLRSKFEFDNPGLGNITYIYIFLLVALCILVIACINFMNLSTARSGKRAKEIGMRKVCGANKGDIVRQFLGESVILSFIAILFSIFLVWLSLPVFNEVAGKQLTMDFSAIGIFTALAIALLTGLLAGSYPAVFLSSFQPVGILRGISGKGKRRGAYFRKILVVSQFVLTITFITSLIVIFSQLYFIKNKDLGFDKENIVFFWGLGELVSQFDAFKNELLKNPNILCVTKASPPIYTIGGVTTVNWEGKDPQEKVMMHPVLVDDAYLETYNMELVQGRFFSKEFSTDISNYVINETAAKLIGVESPVGLRFSYTDDWHTTNRDGKIIGVIKDFHQDSLHKVIPPSVLLVHTDIMNICVKINPNNVPEALTFLETQWKKLVGGGYPFTYEFIDERIDKFYGNERRIVTILKFASLLAIFISCLGMLGLVSYMTGQRTKEIGIRKILGASVSNIVSLLSMEFVKWVIVALIVACPIAWHVMSKWLENFVYRISISWLMFLLAGGTTMIIVFFTVSYQTIKAARVNPVDSLRYE